MGAHVHPCRLPATGSEMMNDRQEDKLISGILQTSWAQCALVQVTIGWGVAPPQQLGMVPRQILHVSYDTNEATAGVTAAHKIPDSRIANW